MYNDEKVKYLYDFANEVRKKALDMALSAGKSGCHIGGSFSSLEIISVLYGAVLKYDIKNLISSDRDIFIASKGHCILSHFASLAQAGFIKESDLATFHENDGLLAGHPWNPEIGLEFSSGSLGMGLSVGIGMAISAKKDNRPSKIYVLLGDGECNEGSVWESFMSASQFKLDNLIAIIDYNNMQFDGKNEDIMSLGLMSEKLKAFGWETLDINGHNIEEIINAFETKHFDKPLAVIAHTKKANGIYSLQDKAESHHAVLTQEDYDVAVKDIEEGKYDRV